MGKMIVGKFTKQLCRLCLTQTYSHFSLIDNQKATEMLEALTSIKIEPTDISTVMCLKCHLNLNLAYKIQQGMLQAEQKIREGFTYKKDEVVVLLGEEIKIETLDEESPPQTFDCHLCTDKFPTLQMLKRHKFDHSRKKRAELKMSTDAPNPDGSYDCPVCSKNFSSRILLVRHRYNHVKRKCPICGKEITASNLHTHIESHNSPPQVCELCGAVLKTRDNLRQHMFYSHNASRHKCDFCEKFFKKKSTRDSHVKKEHLHEANFVCDTCGKKFYTVRNLNTHVKMTHLKLRPYVCDFCNSRFSSSYAMKTHRRQHTNETPYKCEFCGEGFRQKVSLKSHLRSKHKVKEELTHFCDKCEKGFASKIALYTHQRMH